MFKDINMDTHTHTRTQTWDTLPDIKLINVLPYAVYSVRCFEQCVSMCVFVWSLKLNNKFKLFLKVSDIVVDHTDPHTHTYAVRVGVCSNFPFAAMKNLKLLAWRCFVASVDVGKSLALI